MANVDEDEILEILERKNERFERMFNNIDKESKGYVTPNEVKKFWKRKDFDMDMFTEIEDTFSLDEDKEIGLDGKLNFIFNLKPPLDSWY